MLKAIYKRLEAIPVKAPDSDQTQKKFDALKTVYHGLAGQDKSNIAQYLKNVENTQSNTLYQARKPSFLSRLFGLSTSTEKLFKQLKENLDTMKKDSDEPSPPSSKKP